MSQAQAQAQAQAQVQGRAWSRRGVWGSGGGALHQPYLYSPQPVSTRRQRGLLGVALRVVVR